MQAGWIPAKSKKKLLAARSPSPGAPPARVAACGQTPRQDGDGEEHLPSRSQCSRQDSIEPKGKMTNRKNYCRDMISDVNVKGLDRVVPVQPRR